MQRRPMTLTQKILAAHAQGLTRPWVQAGDLLRIRVDWTIASELAWNGMERTYDLLGRPPVHDKERFYLAVDHTVDDVTLKNDTRTQKLVQLSQSFAQESGITHFYDSNETILHTRFYRGLVQPGELVLGADSHTSSHGGLGAFAIGLGGADVAVAMVLGESWIEVPEAISVEYEGELPFGIGGKDVILHTLGTLGRNTVAMERSVEYRGSAIPSFTTDMRFTIANMTAELGGLNGIFEPDEVVATWLSQRRSHNNSAHYYQADDDAPYVERFPIQLNKLAPKVAKPFSPDNVFDVDVLLGEKMDGLFIGACTTTEEELVLGALVLEQAFKDRPALPPDPRRLVVPGSRIIEERLKARGLWAHYEKAGFRLGPPGCSMCLGIASERAAPGEKWLSSQNRNFPNRMGEGSLAYLSSAATVAASAAEGKICDPRPLLTRVDQERFEALLDRKPSRLPEIQRMEPEIAWRAADLQSEAGNSTQASSETQNEAPAHASVKAQTGISTQAASASIGESTDEVLKNGTSAVAEKSQPGLVQGRIQRFGSNIDTDAIIPGEFCHLKSEEELGAHCFHHVRPEFVARVKQGASLVVAEEGWGSGSSREHAVLALKGAGVKAVIAKSYAFIHKRNLVNEALPYLVVSDEGFYELAQEGEALELDLARGEILHPTSGQRFVAASPSPIVSALQREGGIVPAINRHGNAVFQALTGD